MSAGALKIAAATLIVLLLIVAAFTTSWGVGVKLVLSAVAVLLWATAIGAVSSE